MSRGEIALVVWMSIQLLFISAFTVIMFRLYRLERSLRAIDQVLNQRTRLLLYMANMLTLWAEEWGRDPAVLRDRQAPLVQEFRDIAGELKNSQVRHA
jgi:hypothetical protein